MIWILRVRARKNVSILSKCVPLHDEVHHEYCGQTEDNRESESQSHASTEWPLPETICDRGFYHIVRYDGDEDRRCGDDERKWALKRLTRHIHSDRINICKAWEDTEYIVKYLCIDEVLVDESNPWDKLDYDYDHGKFDSWKETKWTVVVFIDTNWFCWRSGFIFFIKIPSRSPKSYEHCEGWYEDGTQDFRIIESRYYDNTKTHDHGGDECSGHVSIGISWGVFTLARHGTRDRGWWDEPTYSSW